MAADGKGPSRVRERDRKHKNHSPCNRAAQPTAFEERHSETARIRRFGAQLQLDKIAAQSVTLFRPEGTIGRGKIAFIYWAIGIAVSRKAVPQG